MLIACLVQVAIAVPDGTGNETQDQAAISPTPTITPTPEPTVEQAVITPEATAIPTPEPTMNATVEQVAVTLTPTPGPTVTNETSIQDLALAANETGNVSMDPSIEVAMLPSNPAFIAYLAQKNFPRVTYKGGHALGYIPSPVNLTNLRGARVSWSNVEAQAAECGMDLTVETAELQASGIPATYDMRTLGRVTGVRDQGECGSCWAFATYGSLESDLLPGQTWDFSENNMLNNHLWDLGQCDGGNDAIALAYLSRWDGPVNERADPYVIGQVTSLTDLKTRKHVQDAYYIPGPWSTGNYNDVKTAIMNYGGIYTLLWWDPTLYRTSTASYYNAGDTMDSYAFYNHAVTLVGWNDNYDRSLFANSPPDNGAFIAKNSWGTGWGDQGYFYISYDDLVAGKLNVAFTAEPVKNYRNEYLWDDLGWVGSIGLSRTDEEGIEQTSSTAWFANVFTAKDKEEVAAVSFYTTDENVDYTAYIYTDPSDGPVSAAGPMSTKSGSIEFAGYHTIKFDTTVPVQAGQRFSVVVRVTNPNSAYTIPIEYNIPDLTSKAVANPGESYVSPDGAIWEDAAAGQLSTDTQPFPDFNVCLKAFTVPPTPPPDARFTATPKKGKLPLKVTFRDRSLRKPTSWLWDFGDGQLSTERNPVHTYAKAGTFTVTLTVKNAGGEDSMEKERLITVTEDTRKVRPHVDHIKKGENPDPFDND